MKIKWIIREVKIRKIIEKCTEVSPDERFQCIEELIIKL